MSDLPTGLARTESGFRVSVWVPWPGYPLGRVRCKRFPPDTPFKTMSDWREDQRVAARQRLTHAATPVIEATGFLADADRYLDAIQAMPTYKERRRNIQEWAALFGDRPHTSIRADEIRAQRDRWLTVGPKMVMAHGRWIAKPIPLSASAVNHRLRALENLWTVLWPNEPNPVRDVPEASEPEPQPRGETFALALEILSFMPDITRPEKGGTHEPGSLSRVRFEALLWTGLPEIQLSRLKPELVDWNAMTFRPPRRAKGRQSRRSRNRRPDTPRPLLPQAVEALTRFFALGAQRGYPWSTSLNFAVKRAIRRANVARAAQRLPPIPETLTVYELTRHTFGTEALRASGNLKAVQDLLGHHDITQTERYALAAVREHVAAATELLAQHARHAQGRGKVRGKVSPHKQARRVRTRRAASR